MRTPGVANPMLRCGRDGHVGTHALDYGRPFDHQSFYRWYFRRYAPPGVRFHDLRHTAASLWLAADISPYKVSRWLGHASLTTTDTIYGHMYPATTRTIWPHSTVISPMKR